MTDNLFESSVGPALVRRSDRRTLVRRAGALGLAAATLGPIAGWRPGLAQEATPRPAVMPMGATPVATPPPGPPVGAVYAMTNAAGPGGNAVVAFGRAETGALTPLGTYPTGGLGTGDLHIPMLEPVDRIDPLISSDALRLSPDGRFLFAVNAGSDTVSAFRVGEDYRLTLLGAVPSGGRFPNSIAARDDLLYVAHVNSPMEQVPAVVVGFRLEDGLPVPIPGSSRPLGDPGLSQPAHALFSPDGRLLVVTDVRAHQLAAYQVGEDGLLTGPSVTPSVGLNPLGARFTPGGVLVVAEAQGGINNDGIGKASVSTYVPAEGGVLRVVSPSVGSGRTASCWITLAPDGGSFSASNTDDGSISSYAIAEDGAIRLLQAVAQGEPTPTPFGPYSGPIDAAMSGDGRSFYQLYGGLGVVGAYRVEGDGRLAAIADGFGGGLPQFGTQGLAAL